MLNPFVCVWGIRVWRIFIHVSSCGCNITIILSSIFKKKFFLWWWTLHLCSNHDCFCRNIVLKLTRNKIAEATTQFNPNRNTKTVNLKIKALLQPLNPVKHTQPPIITYRYLKKKRKEKLPNYGTWKGRYFNRNFQNFMKQLWKTCRFSNGTHGWVMNIMNQNSNECIYIYIYIYIYIWFRWDYNLYKF